MHAFVRMREPQATRAQIVRRIDHLELRVGRTDESVAAVFDAIRKLVALPTGARKRIGF